MELSYIIVPLIYFDCLCEVRYHRFHPTFHAVMATLIVLYTKPQCVGSLLTHGITNKAAYLCKWSNKVTFVISFLIACFFLQSITCKYLARTSFHMIMKFAFKPLLIPAIQGCDFLREHRFVLNYESGTYYIIFSDNLQSYICDLRRVLLKINAAGFTLHRLKCFYGNTKIVHFGFKYSLKGVAPSPEKT